jgi:hypothetical protein
MKRTKNFMREAPGENEVRMVEHYDTPAMEAI